MNNNPNLGNRYDGKTEYSEKRNYFLIILGSLILISVVLFLIIQGIIKSKNCKEATQSILDIAEKYVRENELFPTIEGESITVDLSSLEEQVNVGKNSCQGTVKYTKYKDEYITTYNLINCGYCSTKSHWKKETDKYLPKKQNIDVVPYYNYYETTEYNSNWSEWIPFEDISSIDTNGIKLPINQKQLPSIPEEGNVIEIEKEDQSFYSYRDIKWKWYRNPNDNYSPLSSEQPPGFENKDTITETWTDYTEWSLDYPEEKSYRSIQVKTGYRWYYLDENNEKVYWNSGVYTPDQPSRDYNEKEKDTVKMYRYRDKMWKWYNGQKRGYCSYSAEMPRGCNYKDADLTEYSSWSRWDETSQVTDSNAHYREERTNLHSRYRIKYNMITFLKLDEYVSRDDFEALLERTIPEMSEDPSIIIDIKYKFRYK